MWSVLLTVGCLLMVVEPSFAEWYVAGYGGISLPQSLNKVTMNNLGERLAIQQFPQAVTATDIQGRGTLIQSFNTSDLSLKSSPIFGAKVGYFFNDQQFPWFGVELEAFTSTPTIKSQTVSTSQSIRYLPNTPATPVDCATGLFVNCPASVATNGTLLLQESNLRVVVTAFNLIARYPGKTFQPYIGVGGGAFYFTSSNGSFQGNQWTPGLNLQAGLKAFLTEEWGLFGEAKYNYASLTNFDSTFGLSAQYNAFNFVGGFAYRF
jgi:outer membrane protein W